MLTIPFEDTTTSAPRHTVGICFCQSKTGILTESLNDVGPEVVATLLAPGVHRRAQASRRADGIDVAIRAGQSAVEG
jgi:hypothetical protein